MRGCTVNVFHQPCSSFLLYLWWKFTHSLPLSEQYIPEACQYELKSKFSSYIQAVHRLVQHPGIEYFRRAADDLDKVFKGVAAAKIVGSGIGLTGKVFSVVGAGLGLSHVTAHAGSMVSNVGSPLASTIGSTVVSGAALVEAVEKNLCIKRADKWIRQRSDLCKDVKKKYDDYHEELHRIMELYGKSEEEVIEMVLKDDEGSEKSDLNSNVTRFQTADCEAKLIVEDWDNAFKIGPDNTATAFVKGEVVKKVIKGCQGVISTAMNVNKVTLNSPEATFGLSAVDLGLSAVFVVVDIALIAKAVRNIQIQKGTYLTNKLRQAADAIEEETAVLKQLANFSAIKL